jgi:protein involved in sex pheromone biosynthesis
VEKTEDECMVFSIPRRLTVEEIPDVINHFRIAARNAIDAGNFIFKKQREKDRPIRKLEKKATYYYASS